MKAKNMATRRIILLGALLISALLIPNLLIGSSSREAGISAGNERSIFLAKPVSAEGIDTTFLEEEAGISAYTNVGQQIDLEMARSAFRTIEYETDQYIVGSVALPDYGETEDIHAFVHRDGWVVSYYLRDQPTAKIVDWEDYGGGEIAETKIADGITVVCSAIGVPAGDIKYYHFRYPYANRLMIVAEATYGEDTFRIKLPSDFIFYERSYSHYGCGGSGYWYSWMYIDEEEISRAGYHKRTNYSPLSPSQLSVDVFHAIKITTSSGCTGAFGAIVLIYLEP